MNSKLLSIMAIAGSLGSQTSIYDYDMPKFKRSRGKSVEVRTDPKIGRNEICPKCDSGLKYKKCCGENI